MYCSACGSVVQPSLSYCNYCGAEMNSDRTPVRSMASPDALVWAIVAVTVVGLGGVIGLMAVMKDELHFNDGLIVFFSLLFFLTFLAADSVFIWQLVRATTGGKRPGARTRQTGNTTRELEREMQTALPEPAASVTENTTRGFEPVNRQQNAE